MKKKADLTVEAVVKAMAGATSMTQISKALGYKGSISGSTAKAIRKLVPDVDQMLSINKNPKGGVVAKPEKVAKKVTSPSARGGPDRHPAYPYRAGGAYSAVFDCLARADVMNDGINRDKLVEMVAKVLGKTPKLAGYDVAVVCSPKDVSPTSERDRSAQEGYGIERQNGWVRLVLPPKG